jgi:D-aminoacyl-tRNA deacylase
MRALVQRVTKALVTIDGGDVRSIGAGLVIFLGVTHADSSADVDYLVDKIVSLRIFRDEFDKMNLSVRDISGSCLVISQFTLYGDTRKGRRPSFVEAARPETALPLYERFIASIASVEEIRTETGKFGSDMVVELSNDGPVTFMLESERQS